MGSSSVGRTNKYARYGKLFDFRLSRVNYKACEVVETLSGEEGAHPKSRGGPAFKRTLLGIGVLLALTSQSPFGQVSLKEPDLGRVAEGSVTERGSAQFLINRERSARQAIHIGRSIFHHDFAMAEKSGCNGIPCMQRSDKATRNSPDSRFEASSCASCHNTPAGSAGFGSKEQRIFISRNAVRTPDVFGAGLIQQLALEATEDLKANATERRPRVTSNGVDYDRGLGVREGGSVSSDLVVRPFGRKGTESHLRAFISRAAFKHMGLQSHDKFQCPAGDKDGDGRCDGPVSAGVDADGDGIADELTQGAVSLIEHYLVNYPVPGRGPITDEVKGGDRIFNTIGCTECHRPKMRVRADPRIEHLTIFWNEETGRREAERKLLYHLSDDQYLDPDNQRSVPLLIPNRRPFVVPLYSDLRRHEMGPRMANANNEEGVSRSVFMTRPLWGVGSYTAFLSDGSAATLQEAIDRHGGEARWSSSRFRGLSKRDQRAVIKFLESLMLFSVDDVFTARVPITRGDLP